MNSQPQARGPMSGLWPALLTPLREDLTIDVATLASHSLDLLSRGCAGVTPFGTTGEGPSFGVAERQQAIEWMVEGGIPAEKILVSTSCAALPETVALTRHAVQLGTRASLVLPPFFLKNVPDQGVLDFYTQLIEQVNDPRLQLVLYHIPQVAGVSVSHRVISALLERFPGVVIGLKDSAGQRDASLAYGQAFMPPMQVWVGHEPDLPAMAALGTQGAVSGVANVAPRLVSRLITSRDPKEIDADLARMQTFLGILGGYGMTAAFKGMMAHLTGQPGWRRVRAPLVALSDAEYDRLVEQMKAFGLDPARD